MKHVVVLAIALIFVSGMAMAQESQQVEMENYHYITGYQSAKFGMSKDEVRAAIVNDFGVSEDAIEEMLNLEQGTTILAISVPRLDPGPGPATVFYILGATSGVLDFINIIWATSETPTDFERHRIDVGGQQLAGYFERLQWKPDRAISMISLNPGEILAFTGVDPNDAGVQVIMTGVPMIDAEGNEIELSGSARLQVSYSARFGSPDVITVEPGSF